MLRASFVIDYQNVHLTARDVFAPGQDAHGSLIDPIAFARRAVQVRNSRQREGYPDAEVGRVLVFRGLPHVDYDWEQNRRCTDQAKNWENDGALVELRDLRYEYMRDAMGHPVRDVNGRKIPQGRPQEKGIDVLCALACLREAARTDVDLVVLASRDTDLVPVLDEVYDMHRYSPRSYAGIETVAWFHAAARAEGRNPGGHLRPTQPRRIWNTNLGFSDYEASLDRRDYR